MADRTDDFFLLSAKASQDKDEVRWAAVYVARKALLKRKPKGSWPEAYRLASQRLADSFASGAPRTMRASYAKIQRRPRRTAVNVFGF